MSNSTYHNITGMNIATSKNKYIGMKMISNMYIKCCSSRVKYISNQYNISTKYIRMFRYVNRTSKPDTYTHIS